MLVAEPRKRRRDRHLAAQCRQKEDERNLDARRRGKQRNLVPAPRGTTRRAQVAWRNILFTKDTTREYRESRQEIGRSPQRDDLLCRNGTAQGNSHRKKPHLGQDWARNPKITGAQEKTVDTPGRQNWIGGLERRISRRVTEYKKLDIVEGSTPSKTKKKSTRQSKSRIRGSTDHCRIFVPTGVSENTRERMWKENCRGCRQSGLTGTLSGSRSGRAGFKDGADVGYSAGHHEGRGTRESGGPYGRTMYC
jgi:hypothetical protein